MLVSFLIWLDASPWCYWSLCLLIYAVVIALGFAPSSSRLKDNSRWGWLGHDAVFLLALGVMLLAFRWPVFLFPRQLNPDESGYVSQALTLRHDPVFWRSITAGTSGPVNTYPRLLPGLLGLPDSFLTSRLMALIIAFGTLAVFYFTCRRFASAAFSRLAILAPATFLALTTHGDFTHYSGEHFPVLLLTLAGFIALRLPDAAKQTSVLAFFAGGLLGAVPFAKLQGGVLALVTAVFCYAYLLNRSESWRCRLQRCGWLTLGGLTVPAIVAATAWFSGNFEHFRQSYIVMNFGYAANGLSWGEIILQVPNIRMDMPDFFAYFILTILTGTMGLVWIALGGGWKEVDVARRRLLIFSSVILGTSIFTALAPGRAFSHYFLFLLFPAAAWAFASFATWISQSTTSHSSPEPVRMAFGAWCTLALGGQCADYLLTKQFLELRGHVAEYVKAPRSAIAEAILQYCSPGDPLCVWGWMNEFHAETGTWRATSDLLLEYLWNTNVKGRKATSWRELVPEYFQDLYVEDLKRSKPPVFVDAVAPGSFIFSDRRQFGYETFPALADYLNANYRLEHEIGGIRILVRNDVVGTPRSLGETGPSTGDADSENKLGVSLFNNGRIDEAMPHFERAVELSPAFAEARHNLGLIYLEKGLHDSAIGQFRSEVELRPNDATAQACLGHALARAGRIEEAVLNYNSSLKIDPDRLSSLNNLAWILAARGDSLTRDGARAVELATRARKVSDSGNATVLNTLAAAYAEVGRFAEALEVSQKALEVATANKDEALAKVIREGRAAYSDNRPFHTSIITLIAP